MKSKYDVFVLVSLILFIQPCLSNQQTQQASDEDILEKIEIRGFHDSLIKSLNNKRFNDQIIDTITAQEIGKFPDKNVAEALQRITGISLSRIQGEGERIGVRGTTPEQNRTYLNGQYLASADWWISSQPNRGFNFTLLPADIISSLEVYKTPQADQDEGSLGGAINIKTLDPLYNPDNLLILNTQMQYSDLSGQFDPQFSAIFNTKNANEDLAALFSVTRYSRHLRRDGLESWGWSERNYAVIDDSSLTVSQSASDDSLKNIWTPGGGGSAVFQQHRVLTTFNANIAYVINHHWQLNSYLLYSELDADNTNQNFLWQPAKTLNQGGVLSDYQIIDGTLTSAKYHALSNQRFNTSMEAIWRRSKIRTQSYHLDLTYEGPIWQTQYQIGASKGDGGTFEDHTAQFSANTDFYVNTQEHKNIVAQYAISPLDATQWFLTEARKDAQNGKDNAYFLQLDFNYLLSHPLITEFKFGFKYRDHQRDFIRYRSVDGGLDGLAGTLNTSLADYPDAFVNNYLSNIGTSQTLKLYSFANIDLLKKDFNTLSFTQNIEQASRFNIKERSLAGYLKLMLEGDNYRANLGLRLVNTWQDASAYTQVSEPRFNLINDKKSYLDWLPSVNLNIDLTESIVTRFSVAKVMSRAQFNHIMPSTNYNVTQAQGQGGNPDIDPYRATQFDAGIEWYFQEGALLSATIFNKDVQSFIDFKRHLERHEGVLMSIDRPTNGNGGSIRGLEVSYQQTVFKGFGILTNYTYVDGSRTHDENAVELRIPGTSKHSVNFTGYYENDWLSARVAYNYRTDFATGVGETIMDNYGQIDGNITFIVNDNFNIVMDFINLNDEVTYTYERNEYAPTGLYQNGRRFYLGIRYSL